MVKDLDFAPVKKHLNLDQKAYLPASGEQPLSPRPVESKPVQVRPEPHAKKEKQGFNTKANIITVGLILAFIAVSATGIFIPLLKSPHIAAVIYIFAAIVFRIRSRVSFSVALCFLVFIPLLIIINQQALAETYAIYCFYLLIIGVITATLELRAYKR